MPTVNLQGLRRQVQEQLLDTIQQAPDGHQFLIDIEEVFGGFQNLLQLIDCVLMVQAFDLWDQLFERTLDSGFAWQPPKKAFLRRQRRGGIEHPELRLHGGDQEQKRSECPPEPGRPRPVIEHPPGKLVPQLERLGFITG